MENGETPSSPDQATGRASLTKKVSALVMGEIMPLYNAPGLTPERSAAEWTPVAIAYQDHVGKMNQLRNTLRSTVESVRDYVSIMKLYTRPFDECDEIVQFLLGSILYSRVGDPPAAKLRSRIHEVADDMADEIGLDEGWTGQAAKNMTLDDAITAIMDNELKLSADMSSPIGR